MDDDTFAKLLDKQLNSTTNINPNSTLGSMGVPAGLLIDPIEGTDFAETAQEQMDAIGENKFSRDEYINQPIEFKDIDMGDYFSNLLKSNIDNGSDFLNFAKKQATNAYNVFSKGYVFDVQDFVQDVTSMI